MDTSEELEYVILRDESGQPVKRPRNKLYERVALLQQRDPRSAWPPLLQIAGTPVSEAIISERRGDFD
jgi:hypothetical protein